MSLFYGWKISFLSMSGNFLVQGAAIYCMNAFMEPLCEINGWSRMEINFSLGAAAFMGQVTMPIAAAIAARISLRFLMSLSALLAGLATCGMGLTANIHLFTAFFIIVWICAQFCGGVVGNALMNNWFNHYRGMALGIANAGMSLAGVLLPFICLVIINNFNTTIAYLALGCATCCLAPLCWFIVRKEPADLQLFPDGVKETPEKTIKMSARPTEKNLWRSPAVMAIGFIFGVGLMCGLGIMSQLKPRLSDAGITPYIAIFAASAAAIISTLAKFFWGWICDKTTPILATHAIIFVCFCSLLLSLLPANALTLSLFVLLFSGSNGGMWVVLPAVTSYYFGHENFLNAYKFITIFLFIRCLGYPVMGISFEYCKSYALADMIFVGATFTGFILSLFLHNAKAMEYIKNKR